jgi:uncharacterized membrane protein
MTALLILVPLSVIESMRSISYISLISVSSIVITLVYIFVDNIYQLSETYIEKDIVVKWADLSMVPYFFGTAMQMFEGSAIALDIYH